MAHISNSQVLLLGDIPFKKRVSAGVLQRSKGHAIFAQPSRKELLGLGVLGVARPLKGGFEAQDALDVVKGGDMQHPHADQGADHHQHRRHDPFHLGMELRKLQKAPKVCCWVDQTKP